MKFIKLRSRFSKGPVSEAVKVETNANENEQYSRKYNLRFAGLEDHERGKLFGEDNTFL